MEFNFTNYDFICKNLSAKMKINAESYIKTYNFQKTRTNNRYDLGGTESQRKILKKFVPQKKYSLEVTHVVPFHTQEPGN